MPGSPRRALGRRLAPLAERALGAQMRRASIPALARVVHRLGVDADWVVFGHVHRCGPLAGDDLRQWRGPGGAPRIANTGLVGLRAGAPASRERRRTRTGRAARSGWRDGGEPEAIGLLDHLGAAALHGRPAVASSSTTLPVARRSSMSLQRLGRVLEREALADDRLRRSPRRPGG